MKTKLYLSIILTVFFSLSFISAGFLDVAKPIDIGKGEKLTFDGKEIDYNTLWDTYKPIEIKSNWDIPLLSSTKVEAYLEKHDFTCGINCQSEFIIKQNEEKALIEDIRFYTINEDESKTAQGVRSYQFYIKGKVVPYEVEDFTQECYGGDYAINGTEIFTCEQVLSGTHTEYNIEWIPYNVGDILPAGTYDVKLSAEKKPDRSVDWQIKTYDWIDTWSVWGAGTNAEIDDSQKIGSTQQTNSVLGGFLFNVSSNFILKEVTRVAGLGGPTAYFYSNTTGYATPIATATFSGDTAYFNQTLIRGQVYMVVSGNGGSDYEWSNGAPSTLPATSNNTVVISGGYVNGGAVSYSATIFNLRSITIVSNNSVVTINSPIDNYITNNPTVTFNATANVTGGATITNMSLWHNASGTWVRNYTLTASGISDNKNFTRSFTDAQVFIWGIEACDSDGDCGFSQNRTILIDTSAPIVNILYPTSTISGLTNGQSINLNYSVSDAILQACWREYNGVNTTIGSCANTTFTYVNGVNSIKLWANDSVGNLGSDTKTWNVTSLINSLTFNSSTYETASETLSINATGLTTANLIYNGTSYSASVSGGIASKTLIMSTVIGNKSFYWELNGGTFNSSTSYQYVNPIIFNLCNSTNNLPYVNYTFKDETTNAYINGTIQTSSFTYYLGDGTVTKSLIFSNLTENPSYGFCLSPGSRTLYATPEIFYLSSGYQQRTYSRGIQTYSNTTTNPTLYLLNLSDGIYVTFLVVTTQSSVLSGANVIIQRDILGVPTILSSGTTDGSGAYTIWLNPNYLHTITASKTGYGTVTESITPTQYSYTLILNSGTNYTYISNTNGLLWGYYPHVGLLSLNTSQYFGFNVSSQYGNILKCKIEILTPNKTTVLATGETIATNSSLCTAQTLYEPSLVGNYKLKGRLLVDIGAGYQILEEDAYWILQSVDTTGMTFKDWFDGLTNLDLRYFNNNEQHREYTNILIFFLVVMIICAVLNVAGWDIQTQGGMIFLVGFFIWFASLAGFLNFAYISPIEVINKHFLAIVYTFYMIGYATRSL